MPVIVMCSTKGGVGKSTIAAVLAQVYAKAGSTVTVLDADPNQPLATWAAQFPDDVPERLEVLANITEENVVEEIEAATARSSFVIVDVEGSANIALTYAISEADLVLVPIQGKQLDANQAGRVVKLIDRQSNMIRRKIPYRVIFSRTNVLSSREEKHVRRSLEAAGMPILPVTIVERAAFSSIFQLGGTIYQLGKDDVAAPEKAVANAQALANAVLAEIQTLKKKREAA